MYQNITSMSSLTLFSYSYASALLWFARFRPMDTPSNEVKPNIFLDSMSNVESYWESLSSFAKLDKPWNPFPSNLYHLCNFPRPLHPFFNPDKSSPHPKNMSISPMIWKNSPLLQSKPPPPPPTTAMGDDPRLSTTSSSSFLLPTSRSQTISVATLETAFHLFFFIPSRRITTLQSGFTVTPYLSFLLACLLTYLLSFFRFCYHIDIAFPRQSNNCSTNSVRDSFIPWPWVTSA